MGATKKTEAVRRAIQNSKESIAKLAEHYNLNLKTIVKGRNAHLLQTSAMCPKHARSTVLTQEEEVIMSLFVIIHFFLWTTVFTLLQATISHLTRSSLHRCLQRNGISRLLDVEGEVKAKRNSRYIQSVISIFISQKLEQKNVNYRYLLL